MYDRGMADSAPLVRKSKSIKAMKTRLGHTQTNAYKIENVIAKYLSLMGSDTWSVTRCHVMSAKSLACVQALFLLLHSPHSLASLTGSQNNRQVLLIQNPKQVSLFTS